MRAWPDLEPNGTREQSSTTDVGPTTGHFYCATRLLRCNDHTHFLFSQAAVLSIPIWQKGYKKPPKILLVTRNLQKQKNILFQQVGEQILRQMRTRLKRTGRVSETKLIPLRSVI